MTARGTVLVIEDDALFAALMHETLQQDGYACSVAASLDTARQALASTVFDVIITDIHLPGANGTAVLDVLSTQFEQGVPVIVVTGLPSLESAMRSLDRRVFAYRAKPLVMGELLATVREAVQFGQVRQRLRQTRERLRALDVQLDSLRAVTNAGKTSDLDQSLSEYILLLLGNCGENLAEAADAFRLMDAAALHRPVRHLARHPEADMFRRALEHAVSTLERTKHSFKSRELSELRQQLEATLIVARREQP